MRQLGCEVEKFIVQAYDDIDPRTQNTLPVNSFINAILDQEIKLQVRLKQPKDLSEAIALAETIENAVRQARGTATLRKTLWVNKVNCEEEIVTEAPVEERKP